MASNNLLAFYLLLLAAQLGMALSQSQSLDIYPFNCSATINTCSSYLYHVSNANPSLSRDQIASYYSVNSSVLKPIQHSNRQDYLIPVPCSCLPVNVTTAYFYQTIYNVQPNDVLSEVSSRIYSGQVFPSGHEERFRPGRNYTMSLACGCVQSDTEIVVTYTVQPLDTLTDISSLLSATVSGILETNARLAGNPNNIQPGWVLYVPLEVNGIPPSPRPRQESEKKHSKGWTIITVALVAVSALIIASLIIILLRRGRFRNGSEEDPKAVSKSMSTTRGSSLRQQYEGNIQDATAFESDRPIVYDIQEIEESTSNFDPSKKIGEGGYGQVYFGVLSGQEVAIKKMRSNKSKEFFAELKALCKVHHNNVVELLGYATDDDHFYLVYEYVRNGSLGDHLHDPLLKGYQPLSWTARTQIALDTAKGIEYIHDHTKARYVHRDIKTTNILLDDGLRAKVADFGLAKLVQRDDDDELIATRLVGTPGYLPPESVKELQVTTKTDVFAFGVVLAELITGQRALVRDNRESNKMKSLITVVYKIFIADDPDAALEAVIDPNLRGSYPLDDVYKMAEISDWCLNEEAVGRPEMRDVIGKLSKIRVSSIEWEASLGGSSQIFSGVFNGR